MTFIVDLMTNILQHFLVLLLMATLFIVDCTKVNIFGLVDVHVAVTWLLTHRTDSLEEFTCNRAELDACTITLEYSNYRGLQAYWMTRSYIDVNASNRTNITQMTIHGIIHYYCCY